MFESREYQFFHTVFNRPVRFTYVFFAANILIYLLMELAGGSDNPWTLLAFGGKSNEAIANGEIWRFITPTFIHIGLIHLAVNSFTLWKIGPAVEKFYGEARFVLLYILSGAGAVLAGYLASPDALSAGASGSLMGLCGVLVVFGLRNRDTVPAAYRKFLLQNLIASIAITLFLGFRYGSGSDSGIAIDNAGHIGGLITGAALAAFIPYSNPFETHRSGGRLYRPLQALGLIAALASFGTVAMHYDGPKPSVMQTVQRWKPGATGQSGMDTFIDAVNGAQRIYRQSWEAIQSGDATAVDEASKETAEAIGRIENMPSIGKSADRWALEFLAALRNEYALEKDIVHAGTVTPTLDVRAEEQNVRFLALVETFEMWIATEGYRYGISLGADQ